jgi:putative ABC transport system ATP-binding protein
MTALEPSLRGIDLTRTFGEGDTLTVALNDVSVDLYPGEFVVVMGPSGGGKSTLLAVLSGLLRPQQGQTLALGHDLWAMSDEVRRAFRLKHFGFIFQHYNLFPMLTAREQLEIVLRLGEGVGAREARTRAVEVLELLGLGKKTTLFPDQLSGGEKQRVAIGRALVKNPSFCFADEPTSALDWKHGEQVVEQLRYIAKDRGATVLVVAHEERIVGFADRVLRLQDGSLRDSAATAAVSTS